ncbi:hypothetical protein [uncultured Ruminococcus sp.]|uniref:hypothetical protein n=1 Tax=uncultured Ruminococcus sp. TaxID=165186 RepID=UPI0026004DDF|nr:hypothetical protein [uncultured Ruminococcus sp.]
MKKKLKVLAAFTAFFFIKNNSLERKIFFNSISISEFDFDSVNIDDKERTLEFNFKNSVGNDHLFDTINGIYTKCKQIVANDEKYRNYDVALIIKDAAKVVFYMSDSDIYCARNHTRLIISVADISRAHPDLEYLTLDDIYIYESGVDVSSALSGDEIYADYCNVDNYRNFTQLKYVSFCVRPSYEVLNYLKERFPDCVIECKYP